MKVFEPIFYTEKELESLDGNDIVFPYSDKNATYVGKDHQYELTKEYFIERGRNLDEELCGNNPEKVKYFLQSLRRKFYKKIYTRCGSTRPQLNYIIAKRGIRGYTLSEYRDAFLENMYDEGCYLLDNGDISSVTGVDLDTMQNMSADVIREQERDFKVDVLRGLTELGLGYRGRYRFMVTGQGEDW